MAATVFADNAKVMSKNQVTIPPDVRAALGVSTGDEATFTMEENVVRVASAASYAMQVLQSQMEGATEATDIAGEEDVDALIATMRAEG